MVIETSLDEYLSAGGMQSGLWGTGEVENKKVHELRIWHKTVSNCNGGTACFEDKASKTQRRRAVSNAGQVGISPEGRSSDRTPGQTHCDRVPRFQGAPRHFSGTDTDLDSSQLISNFQVSWRCDAVPLGE